MNGWPLRVTQVVFDLNGGGMESLVAEMASRWQGTSVTMSVITLSGRVGHVGESVQKVVDDFRVLRPSRGVSMLAPTRLAAAIRETRPDVVHLHTGAWLKGAYAARLAGVPWIVYTEHGREHHDPALTRMQDHLAARWTHRVVTVSARLAGYMHRAIGVANARIVTIPNGVDTTRFAPGPPNRALRAALSIPDDAVVIGSVGRIEPVKAYDRLVEVYARLRADATARPLMLVIFGDGSDRKAVEAAAERFGVRDGVRFPGWVDRPVDAYRTLDLFAMTSRSEGMSISLMEAMACGITPLVTDVGSNAEVIGNALPGHVVPDFDAAAFVARARTLVTSSATREAAGHQARERIAARYDLSTTLARYEQLYRHRARSTAPAEQDLEELGVRRAVGRSVS